MSAFDALLKTGGLQPRMPQPSAGLVAARDAVSKLIVRWDDSDADRIAAVNLFLDRSKDRRRAEIDALRTQVGSCAMPDRFDTVENALRGDWTMRCERGNVQVAITLAPTAPPAVQFLLCAGRLNNQAARRRAPKNGVSRSTSDARYENAQARRLQDRRCRRGVAARKRPYVRHHIRHGTIVDGTGVRYRRRGDRRASIARIGDLSRERALPE
jgi:hypothetical protein